MPSSKLCLLVYNSQPLPLKNYFEFFASTTIMYNTFHLMPNLWLFFFSSRYKNLMPKDSNFCCKHEDCLLLQDDRISCLLFQRPVILDKSRVILWRNINNTSLSSSLVEIHSKLVIISDTSTRPPSKRKIPPYSLQLSSFYDWAWLRNFTLSSLTSKIFYSCVGTKIQAATYWNHKASFNFPL